MMLVSLHVGLGIAIVLSMITYCFVRLFLVTIIRISPHSPLILFQRERRHNDHHRTPKPTYIIASWMMQSSRFNVNVHVELEISKVGPRILSAILGSRCIALKTLHYSSNHFQVH